MLIPVHMAKRVMLTMVMTMFMLHDLVGIGIVDVSFVVIVFLVLLSLQLLFAPAAFGVVLVFVGPKKSFPYHPCMVCLPTFG